MLQRLFTALTTTLFLAPLATPALGNIPQPVIEQCNATATASSLPDCLKDGAIAYEMLELVRSEDFYGSAAAPVISECEDRNETFSTTWSCFQRAADNAAETRGLIGVDNIADRCIAGISDEALAPRIREIYRERRRQLYPNGGFYSGNMFYPFQGCPEPVEPEGSASADTVPEPDETASIGPDGCAALNEIEAIIASRSAGKLRELSAELRDIGDPDARELGAATGLSEGAADYVLSGDDDRGWTIAATLGVFLRAHHPELLMEFFQQHETTSPHPGADMGDAMAQAFVTMIIDAADDRFRSECGAS
ncbi:hypothetical protein [Alkalilacustris brevis]|uniref:hypothetical protein n=1 Tax=Alkalilacustris brevis TaxID=2026338 RepID=UPI0012D3199A|nr:hypothetical protein [Alkalilacustris brevis]